MEELRTDRGQLHHCVSIARSSRKYCVRDGERLIQAMLFRQMIITVVAMSATASRSVNERM